MKIAIIYSSLTNNTKLLAETIYSFYKENVSFISNAKENINFENLEADVIFLGSWTDKGDISNDMIKTISKIKNRKVFLFGTCGFGGSLEYFESIYERFKNHLDSSNKIIGHFYCQGKMPLSVKDKYIKLITQNPEDKGLKVSLENFEQASSHPDENDIYNLTKMLKSLNLN